MINFFRRIRKKLADDNSPGGRAGKLFKYTRYAIGEIVLVVIGILIALQINTWNENQKKDEQSAIYLFDLRNDIAFDIETLKERISNNTNRINKADSIIYTLATKKDFHFQKNYDTV